MDPADRHFHIFQMIREKGPIDPDKQVPGIPRQPAVPPGLEKQKRLSDIIRGEKMPHKVEPRPKVPPMGGVRG